MDKRNVYDFDIRIHLTAMGPGIRAGTIVDAPATNVDLAPTLLGLAGIQLAADDVDGKSLVPFLVPQSSLPAAGRRGDMVLPLSVEHHLHSLPGDYHSQWRTSVFIEYYYVGITPQCDQGVPIEEPDNNFIAVRSFPTAENPLVPDRLYAEFDNGTTGFMTFERPQFYELFVQPPLLPKATTPSIACGILSHLIFTHAPQPNSPTATSTQMNGLPHGCTDRWLVSCTGDRS